jgi:hypothetical protein
MSPGLICGNGVGPSELKVNSDLFSRDVDLWSPARGSVLSGFHKISEPAKESKGPHDLGAGGQPQKGRKDER